MPTFTAIALDRLLEPGSRNPAPKPPPVPIKVDRPAQKPAANKSIPLPRLNISPALYATPETRPLPDSPSSFPPSSPYIIKHKRRGPRLIKSLSLQNDVGATQPENGVTASEPQNVVGGVLPPVADAGKKVEVPDTNGVEVVVNGSKDSKVGEEKAGDGGGGRNGGAAVEFRDSKPNSSENGFVGAQDLPEPVSANPERDGEIDDFFDPQDSLSTASNTDVDDSYGPGRWKPSTPLGEYYDAFEEIASDGTTRSSYQNIEDELREMRLNLLMEIERRKQAEEALENLQIKWQMLSHHLSLVGFRLPAPPSITDELDDQSQSSIDPAEELCQQVVVARFVSDAIGRACSRAEVEMEMEPTIEAKNFEIARLWDRLQFYESANSEMSKRNQEAVEMARQQRNRRKRRQKWFWSSIGVIVTLGTAAIAWSYMPSSRPPSEGDNTDSHSNEN